MKTEEEKLNKSVDVNFDWSLIDEEYNIKKADDLKDKNVNFVFNKKFNKNSYSTLLEIDNDYFLIKENNGQREIFHYKDYNSFKNNDYSKDSINGLGTEINKLFPNNAPEKNINFSLLEEKDRLLEIHLHQLKKSKLKLKSTAETRLTYSKLKHKVNRKVKDRALSNVMEGTEIIDLIVLYPLKKGIAMLLTSLTMIKLERTSKKDYKLIEKAFLDKLRGKETDNLEVKNFLLQNPKINQKLEGYVREFKKSFEKIGDKHSIKAGDLEKANPKLKSASFDLIKSIFKKMPKKSAPKLNEKNKENITRYVMKKNLLEKLNLTPVQKLMAIITLKSRNKVNADKEINALKDVLSDKKNYLDKDTFKSKEKEGKGFPRLTRKRRRNRVKTFNKLNKKTSKNRIKKTVNKKVSNNVSKIVAKSVLGVSTGFTATALIVATEHLMKLTKTIKKNTIKTMTEGVKQPTSSKTM